MELQTKISFRCENCGNTSGRVNDETCWNRLVIREKLYETSSHVDYQLVARCNNCDCELVLFDHSRLPISVINNALVDVGVITSREPSNYMRTPEGYPNNHMADVERTERTAEWHKEQERAKAEYEARPPVTIELVRDGSIKSSKNVTVLLYTAYRVLESGRHERLSPASPFSFDRDKRDKWTIKARAWTRTDGWGTTRTSSWTFSTDKGYMSHEFSYPTGLMIAERDLVHFLKRFAEGKNGEYRCLVNNYRVYDENKLVYEKGVYEKEVTS